MESTYCLYRETIRPYVMDPANYGAVYPRLAMMIHGLGIRGPLVHARVLKIIKIIYESQDEPIAKGRLRAEFRDQDDNYESLKKRAEYFSSLLKLAVGDQKVLAFGSGDGLLALDFQKRQSLKPAQVHCYDIVDYRVPEVADFPFSTDWDEMKAMGPFDIAWALTVFHHCDDPALEVKRLSECVRRFILLESVVSDVHDHGCRSLVDWFYNQGLHDAQIPVPGGFRTPEKWDVLMSEHGFEPALPWVELGIHYLLTPMDHRLRVYQNTRDI